MEPAGTIVFVAVCPSVHPSVRLSKLSFLHFFPQCFEILHSNLVHSFILKSYSTSSTLSKFRQFFMELWLFKQNLCLIDGFPHFLCSAFRYCIQIFCIALSYRVTVPVRLWLNSVNYSWSYGSLNRIFA